MGTTEGRAAAAGPHRGPRLLVGLAVVLLVLQLPGIRAHPPWDVWINLGAGWAWRTHAGINVYNPPEMRRALYESEPYGGMREVSAYGLPFNSYVSTPTPLLVYIPLSLLGPRGGRLAWFTVSVVLYLGVLVFLLMDFRRRGRPWLAAGLALYAVFYYPVLQDWRLGQTDTLLLVLLCVTGWCVERRRDAAAGVCVALLTLFKLYPGLLLLYFAWKRAWRLVAAFAVTFVAVGAVSVAVVGWRAFVDFCTIILPITSKGSASWHNQGFSGLWLHLQHGAEGLGSLMPPEAGRPLPLVLLSVAFVAVAAWRLRGPLRRADFTWSADYGLLWATMFMAAPIVWEHYFAQLLLPLAGRWLAAVERPSAPALALLVPATVAMGFVQDVRAGWIVELRPLALVLFWLLCLWQAGGSHTDPAREPAGGDAPVQAPA